MSLKDFILGKKRIPLLTNEQQMELLNLERNAYFDKAKELAKQKGEDKAQTEFDNYKKSKQQPQFGFN